MTRAPGRRQVVLAALALIVLGATAGITTDRLLNGTAQAEPHHPSAGGAIRISDIHADPIDAIDRAVRLRPEQRTRVARIIERRQSELDAVWHEARTRIMATVDSVIEEITAELDPEQAERFRAFHDDLHGPSHRDHGPPR
jgi:hypothetical protein